MSEQEKKSHYDYFYSQYIRQCNISRLAHNYAAAELDKLLKEQGV